MVTGKVTGYAYYVNSTNTDIISTKMENMRVYDLIFKGTDTKPYWLTSCGILAYSEYAVFGLATVDIGDYGAGVGTDPLFDSSGGENDYGFTVRPVVVLKPDVMAEMMQKMAD